LKRWGIKPVQPIGRKATNKYVAGAANLQNRRLMVDVLNRMIVQRVTDLLRPALADTVSATLVANVATEFKIPANPIPAFV
jgi:hypothetical protein